MSTEDSPKPQSLPSWASSPDRWPHAAGAEVAVRSLNAAFVPQMVLHLLALDRRDRYLRFGYEASDAQIRAYVDGIDFGRDHLLGIFDHRLRLVAWAHLAFPTTERHGQLADTAEFGVSVAREQRRRGYGTRLFERAAIHAVNRGASRLEINALSANTAMLRIAERAGAVIERMGPESRGRLRLPEATFMTRLRELMEQSRGEVDYGLKAEAARQQRRLGGRVPGQAD